MDLLDGRRLDAGTRAKGNRGKDGQEDQQDLDPLPGDGAAVDGVTDESAASRVVLPTTGARSPRYGPDYLLYVSSKRGQEGIWKLAGDDATELWSRPQTRLVGAPAISPDGRRIAFTADRNGESRLHVMDADGSRVRQVARFFDTQVGNFYTRPLFLLAPKR